MTTPKHITGQLDNALRYPLNQVNIKYWQQQALRVTYTGPDKRKNESYTSLLMESRNIRILWDINKIITFYMKQLTKKE